MSVVLTADHLPVQSRADYWRDVLGDMLGTLDPFGARRELRIGDLGALRVGELTADQPCGASRTPAHIRRRDLDLCKIDVLARGRGVIEQDDRTTALVAGDLTFVDLSRPARWSMSQGRIVTAVFPRALLPLPQDKTAQLTAVRIPGREGAGALVSTVAQQLVRRVDEAPGVDLPRLGAAVLDLVTAALSARLGDGHHAPWQTQRHALLSEIHAFIERRLDDPDVTPDAVAAAHHISVRYLHKLFETEQLTVARLIQQRRLDRCRRDLLDPRLTSRPVSAIAARWGLTNATHFSRIFRAAYGVPPAEYRNMSRAGRSRN
jgi:AraC-like DNA-binding protein